MGKKLCDLKEQDGNEKTPKYRCKRCERASRKESKLCKPQKI